MSQWLLLAPDPFINHNKLITAVQLNGCPKEVYSTTEIYWFISVDTWKTCVTLGLCDILGHLSSIAGSGKRMLWFALFDTLRL
jgi:hypothetical protein